LKGVNGGAVPARFLEGHSRETGALHPTLVDVQKDDALTFDEALGLLSQPVADGDRFIRGEVDRSRLHELPTERRVPSGQRAATHHDAAPRRTRLWAPGDRQYAASEPSKQPLVRLRPWRRSASEREQAGEAAETLFHTIFGPGSLAWMECTDDASAPLAGIAVARHRPGGAVWRYHIRACSESAKPPSKVCSVKTGWNRSPTTFSEPSLRRFGLGARPAVEFEMFSTGRGSDIPFIPS